MNEGRPLVIRGDAASLAAGPPTPGMERRELLDHDQSWVGWLRTTPGMAGGWHHHGERDSYIFIMRGSIAIEFGPGGRERVTGSAGDFIFNPRRIIHREITGEDEPVEAFVVRVGSGPPELQRRRPGSRRPEVDGPEVDGPEGAFDDPERRASA